MSRYFNESHSPRIAVKTVGIVEESAQNLGFDQYPEIIKEYPRTPVESILMLNKGRLDVAAIEKDSFTFISEHLGLRHLLESVYNLTDLPMYIVFSKTYGKKGERWAAEFSEILKQLKKEGFIERELERFN